MARANVNARRERDGSSGTRTGRPAKATTAISKRRALAAVESEGKRDFEIGEGVYAGIIELSTDASLRVRLANGSLITATAAPGLDPRLVDECLRDRRTVLVTGGAQGAVVLGALQTSASPIPTRDRARTRIAGEEIEIEAESRIALRVGKAALVIEQDGSVRFVGDRMSLRMAKLLKVLSANVELP